MLAAGSSQGATGEALPDPFDDARFVPASVTQYYCFVEAGEELGDLLKSSLAPGLAAFYEKARSGRSWREFAQSTGVDPKTLFDMLASQRVTLVTDEAEKPRGREEREDFSRWVLMARVEEPAALDLLRLLNGRVREFAGATAIYAAEGGSLRFAYREGRFYVAASDAQPLLQAMLAPVIEPCLADDEEFREARRVGPGDFGMFRRGRGDVHWEAGAAKMRRTGMHVSLVKRHEPRTSEGERADAISLGLLGMLAQDAIYVNIERTPDPAQPPCERTVSTGVLPLVPVARAKPEMLEHLGPTMVTLIEPALESATGVPVMTVAIELRDPRLAVGELDEFMADATARLSNRRHRTAEEPASETAVLNAGAAPEVLRVAECRGSEMPLRLVGLEGAWPRQVVWSSLITPERAWWIASTDKDSQSRLVERLESFTETCRRPSNSSARGVLIGDRLATLMQQWPAVHAQTRHPFLVELFAWRELLQGVRDIKWRVARPSDDRTETYVSVSWRREGE